MKNRSFKGMFWGRLKIGMASCPKVPHIETFNDKRETFKSVHLSHKQVKSLIKKLQGMEKEMDKEAKRGKYNVRLL